MGSVADYYITCSYKLTIISYWNNSIGFWLFSFQKIISYREGGTQTGKAINSMVSDLFGHNSGARNKEEKVPRIGIVMTDGQSDDGLVLGPADAAREQEITLYAIGIGSGIEEEELNQIANDPDEKYVVYVNDYTVIDNIRYEISQDTCEGK